MLPIARRNAHFYTDKPNLNNKSSTRLRRCLRLVRLLLHILYGLAIASTILPRVQAAQRQHIIRRWSARMLAMLDIRVIVSGSPPPPDIRGALFVANHVSWVDIQAIHSVQAVRFIAKDEIRGWPVFGSLATRANTLFIERTRRHDAGRIVEMVAARLRAGDCICFFPEGTTSDGSTVQPFKSSLMQAAIDAQIPVRPVAIRYPAADGSLNKQMAYYGEMSLWQSIKRVLARRSPTVELRFLPPIPTDGLERHEVALRARRAILQALTIAH